MEVMEEWELDFEWLQIQHYIKESMDRNELPDLQAVMFLIGIQESGQIKEEFTKEEKQDLMHIAVCTLLSEDGYFEFVGNDHDGWPHWKQVRGFDNGLDSQDKLLKEKIIRYFKDTQL